MRVPQAMMSIQQIPSLSRRGSIVNPDLLSSTSAPSHETSPLQSPLSSLRPDPHYSPRYEPSFRGHRWRQRPLDSQQHNGYRRRHLLSLQYGERPILHRWQDENRDLNARTAIIQEIARILHMCHPRLDVVRRQRIPQNAQKLESILYRAATSLDEYSNMKTLSWRLRRIALAYKVSKNQGRYSGRHETEQVNNSLWNLR